MALAELLIATVLLGLAGGGLASVVRAAPWAKRWLSVKPLGCPLCMGWWSSLFMRLAINWTPGGRGAEFVAHFPRWGTVESGFLLAGATAIAAWLTAQTIQPPIELPNLEPPKES